MGKRKLNLTILNWWNRLSQDEQDILIEVLYDLDLNDYVEFDADGTILMKKKTS